MRTQGALTPYGRSICLAKTFHARHPTFLSGTIYYGRSTRDRLLHTAVRCRDCVGLRLVTQRPMPLAPLGRRPMVGGSSHPCGPLPTPSAVQPFPPKGEFFVSQRLKKRGQSYSRPVGPLFFWPQVSSNFEATSASSTYYTAVSSINPW
jgi:hypothetical protein